MAKPQGVTGRERVIEQFAEQTNLEVKAMEAMTEIVKRAPQSILIAWEDDEGVSVTTIPNSKVLARGMADILFEMLIAKDDEE